MQKINKYKITPSLHSQTTYNTGVINKRYHTTLLHIAATFVVLTCVIAATSYVNICTALGFSTENGATDPIAIAPNTSSAPSSSSLLSSSTLSDTIAAPMTSKSLIIAAHLRTHIFTLFSQPTKIFATTEDGVPIDGASTSTTVSPLKEKIVYVTLPADKVLNGQQIRLCAENQKYGKQDCTEEMNNFQQIEPGQTTDVYLTVP